MELGLRGMGVVQQGGGAGFTLSTCDCRASSTGLGSPRCRSELELERGGNQDHHHSGKFVAKREKAFHVWHCLGSALLKPLFYFFILIFF